MMFRASKLVLYNMWLYHLYEMSLPTDSNMTFTFSIEPNGNGTVIKLQ